MKTILKIVAILFIALFAILVAKTFSVKSRQIQAETVEKLSLDSKLLTNRFAAALRIQTISYDDPKQLNPADFFRFHDYLRETFPLVHSNLILEKVHQYSLLYRWEGADLKLPPWIVMAHMDIVPVEGSWKHPAFGGVIADSYIWGRGALDDKSCLISQLEAVEYLLKRNFKPQQTIYFAFGHDEEAGGQGAAAIAALLNSRRVKADLILDEGGAILNEFIPGVIVPTAMIGTSEKGYATIELSLQETGGHSSAPPRHSAIGVLSEAVRRLEEQPMRANLEGSAAEMLDYLAPELPFVSRFFVANRWFFQPLINFALSKGGITETIVRTTTAVTMIRGGVKENVLPTSATATVNFRIRPGETIEDVVRHVRKTISNEKIKIELRPQRINPSPISSSESSQFELLHRTIRQIYPDVVVVPGMVIGATDARHYAAVSKNIFRFAPFRVSKEDFRGVHGTDERIRVDGYLDMIRFYVQLFQSEVSAR
jgi:carboxypeptidase PM20D1